MVRATPSLDAQTRKTIAAASAMVIIVCLGMAAVLGAVSHLIDRHELSGERALVERRISRLQEALTEDVTSATIWNDAVLAFAGPAPDRDWLQLNFGDYYADYMDHAVTLAYGPDGGLVAAYRDSEAVPPADEQAFADAVAPLVSEARRRAQARDRSRYGFDAVTSRTGIVSAGAERYVVSVATVVPEDESAPRLAGDPVVVSAKPVSALVDSLRLDLGLERPRFVLPGQAMAASVEVAGPDGASLGAIAWSPQQPGKEILLRAGPLMLALLAALAAAGGFLYLRVKADVRRLTESEAALAAALKRAEAGVEAKSRFLSNISHELRTPLNGVLGMAAVMELGELNDLQRRNLGVLKGSARSLLALIERVLDVVRLDQDRVRLESAPFEPDRLLRTVRDDHAEAARAKGLVLSIDGAAPGLWIGDEAHLKKAVACLVENAIRFTPEGQVRLRARPAEAGLVIEVQDTGVGMDGEAVARLFDPFTQVDESSTRRADGAGLGLTLCRRIIDQMRGDIEVESRPGEGCLFRLRLPLPRAQPVGTRPAPEPPADDYRLIA